MNDFVGKRVFNLLDFEGPVEQLIELLEPLQGKKFKFIVEHHHTYANSENIHTVEKLFLID